MCGGLAQPLLAWLPLLSIPSAGVPTPVYSNTHWLDVNGSEIEAHAAGILRNPQDGRFYWYGESEKVRTPNDEGGVNCYSAPEIAGPWKFEGQVLAQEDIVVENFTGPWIVERPKVLYNSKTNKFVMWFHLDVPLTWKPKSFLATRSMRNSLDQYIFQHAAVATASNASGPFTFITAMLPDGKHSLDLNLFQDPMDGTAYLLRDVSHCYIGISRLSPDFLNTTGIISKIPTSEGMAMFRMPNGTYYVLSSHLSGWDPSPMIAWRSNSTNLDGAGWENLGNPTRNRTSFFSQPTSVFQYTPMEGRPYFVYVGDNWMNCANLTSPSFGTTTERLQGACYVWLPIKMNPAGNPIELEYRDAWDLEFPWKHSPTDVPEEELTRAVAGTVRMHDSMSV